MRVVLPDRGKCQSPPEFQGGFCVPLLRLERRPLPPEGSALSAELQGQYAYFIVPGLEVQGFVSSLERFGRNHAAQGIDLQPPAAARCKFRKTIRILGGVGVIFAISFEFHPIGLFPFAFALAS